MLNKVCIIGRLGADPEVKTIGSGQVVANFNVATSESWKDKNGEKQERTDWHRVVVWGKLAELCGKHLQKGSLVYAEGKLQNRSWEDSNQAKRTVTEIIASVVQFLDRKQTPPPGAEDFAPEPMFGSGDEIPF